MSQDIEVNVEVVGLPKYAWLFWIISGLITTVVGVWLLLSPRVAISTLALLIGIGLLVNGISELANASQSRSPIVGYILGALFVIGGILVFFRPAGRASALLFLAIVVGVTMIITGLGEMYIAFSARDEIEHWLVLAFMGAMGVIVGVFAVAWPTITIFALAILLGIRMVFVGVAQIGVGLRVRSLTQ
ncbi:MAG: DUF308 domain-containing protein [Microthrixaceae bacterium]|nr:DUF308 domain-containing protein [Microthrixaceae bacterium]